MIGILLLGRWWLIRKARRPGPTLLAGAVAVLALGAAFGWAGHGRWANANHSPRPGAFKQIRTTTIEAQLDQVEGAYIITMGDSHAERLYLPSLCGLPIVNAGISGATASDVLDLARLITPRRKAAGLLLSVGTNDIWLRRRPEAASATEGFRNTLAALQEQLLAWTSRVALVAIPPVARKEEASFPRSTAARYSTMLAQSCEAEHCAFIDLFGKAAPDEEASAFGADGVHLRDYGRHVRAQEPTLCARLGLPTRN